ncbi:MAG: hypothetical protein QM401_08405 [Bacillota bacterium]|nr:hypothetical protein [Bacillota bacterium]HHU61096.1 hypothetical protein [Natronincola sp.]
MPRNKKQNPNQKRNQQQKQNQQQSFGAGGLGNTNNFFETAEELANRQSGNMQKRRQNAQNPEKPQQ